MTRSIRILGGSAIAALAIAATAPAVLAQSNDDPAEAKAFLSAGMTLADAAAAAEADSGGTAMGASWEPAGSGQMAFEVELAQADGSVTTVMVDPGTGAVTAAKNGTGDDATEGEDDDNGQRDEAGDDNN